MQKYQRKFHQHYNEVLIDLIRHKLSPLQQHKKHCIPTRPPDASKSMHVKLSNTSFPSLPSSKMVINIYSEKENTEVCLLDKVKMHLESKRKEKHIADERNSLNPYIQLFSRPVSQKDRRKRQSIELNVFEPERIDRPTHDKQMIGFREREIDLNDDQRSLLNANLRRKLNHKKIVDLNRRF